MKKFFIGLALLLVAWAGNVGAADVPIGAGDVMKISVFGNADLSLEAKVSEAGSISYPLIGEVAVAGLSPSAAERKIAELLENGGFVRKPQVNIIVVLLQSQQVSVLGHVNKPGRYPIDGTRSLTDLLAIAGGINADGGDVVTVIRNRDGTTLRDTVDVVEMVRTGDMTRNIDLRNNDIVYVERAPRFYIYGEVQRPGFYRLEPNMTVLHALSAGGGLTPRGTERGISIKRRNADGKLEVLSARHEDVVNTGDVVHVQESLF